MSAEETGQGAPSQRLWGLTTWLLNNVAGRGNRFVAERLGRPGLRTKFAVLAGLAEFGPNSQAGLSRKLGIDRGDLVSVLNELEREGLAVREPDEADRRRNTIRITADGSRAMAELGDLVSDAQDALLAPLSAVERGELNRLLQRLVEHHAAAG
ncbi:MarR family winged helix-turn-helix transcriptional regulator [Amycolatopsis sp. lyj-109]|uniref:MarR family winged helix-turn-helix transcriptional regulator n=1 Tax=Amycolatopsis sp. lyj-109 TaxID=2789287 RepID=UPI00397DFCCD